MIYLKLFWSFIQIGLFSIGGGYAALPLIQNQVVELNKWLSMEEFVDLITIAEMTPGPIAINASTFVGTRIAGIGGAIISTFGCVLPSLIIVLTLAYFYYRYNQLTIVQGILSGLRPAVVSLIASAGLGIAILTFRGNSTAAFNFSDINLIAVGLFTVSFIIMRKFKPNPIVVMIGSGIAGILVYLL
ncbi:MAG: chromate transporter [Clostridiaceae bacterium]|jgi:chromate transporter|nr:chromate transporter [Clostridiaceae bacterium]